MQLQLFSSQTDCYVIYRIKRLPFVTPTDVAVIGATVPEVSVVTVASETIEEN
jgi:hypothetical protein